MHQKSNNDISTTNMEDGWVNNIKKKELGIIDKSKTRDRIGALK